MKPPYPLATFAGVMTWAIVFAVTLYIMQLLAPPQPWLLVSVLFILYGIAFIVLTLETALVSLHNRAGKLLLLLQLLSAFALSLLLPSKYFDYLAILTVIWVSLLPSIMSNRSAVLVAIAVVTVWFCLITELEQRPMWISAVLYGCFHLFAVIMQSATQAEQKAKEELASKHQQLLATQQLLQAASRQSERTRIARNLHDVVGHHLTALTIQLQVASHITEGEAKIQVDKCHQLAKLLLSDVREAVSTMRQYAGVTLLDAITPLLALLPERLEVKLQIPPDIMLNDLHQAQHLLCMVQEAISNSLKHSGASQLHLIASVKQQQLQLVIYDNGSVSPHWQPGNGIKGMQERLTECGGHLQLGKQQQAIQLTITLPYIESENA
jgi:two-component system sensor histidine kinase DesK